MKADLHCHTTKSDGKRNLNEVIKIAEDLNLDFLAITNHDILNDELNHLKSRVKIIKGIELSTTNNAESVHLLGYFINNNQNQQNLKDFLKNQQIRREERGRGILELLDKIFKIKLEYEEIKNDYGIVARPHIARAIIKSGYHYTYNEIFNEMIGDNKPAYLPSSDLSTAEGIKLLHDNNCIVILAHPVLLKRNQYQDLLKLGMDGIEAIYPKNTRSETRRLLKLKSQYVITAGSDFHGDEDHAYLGKVLLEGELLERFLTKINLR